MGNSTRHPGMGMGMGSPSPFLPRGRESRESRDRASKSPGTGVFNSSIRLGDQPSPLKAEKPKVLPPEEALPRSEVLGGYIFVCNNETMQEDLRRQLFGLPQRYRDSVRTIRPGLPLFLYNYTTHQLHGVFEATSFGGSNLDPTAWEDKKAKGESRFPAQVRIRVRKMCRALDEEEFRPFLHHYDGPKFRLELSIPETLALLDIFDKSEVQFPYPGLRNACKDRVSAPKALPSRRVLAG